LTGNGSVAVSATGAVTLDEGSTALGTIAVAAGGAVTVADSGALTVGSVAGVTGVSAGAGDIGISAGTGTALTVAQAVTATGTGMVSLSGSGVDLSAATADVSSGSGNLTVAAGSGTFNMAVGSSLATSGNITIAADSIALTGLIQATGGASEVKLAPDTGGTAINLGAMASSGFALDAAELNTIEAPVVRIGSAAGAPFGGATSGAITLTGNFTPDNTFGTTVLELRTTGAVTATAGVLDLETNKGANAYGLVVRAGDVVDISTAAHKLNTVAATTTGLGKNITVADSNGFTVGTVDTLVGIGTAGGAGTTGSIALATTAGNLVLANNVTTGNSATLPTASMPYRARSA
jgi:hypothetical protein